MLVRTRLSHCLRHPCIPGKTGVCVSPSQGKSIHFTRSDGTVSHPVSQGCDTPPPAQQPHTVTVFAGVLRSCLWSRSWRPVRWRSVRCLAVRTSRSARGRAAHGCPGPRQGRRGVPPSAVLDELGQRLTSSVMSSDALACALRSRCSRASTPRATGGGCRLAVLLMPWCCTGGGLRRNAGPAAVPLPSTDPAAERAAPSDLRRGEVLHAASRCTVPRDCCCVGKVPGLCSTPAEPRSVLHRCGAARAEQHLVGPDPRCSGQLRLRLGQRRGLCVDRRWLRGTTARSPGATCRAP